MKKVIIAVAMLFAVSASFAQAETRAGSTRKQVTVKSETEKTQELESFITKLNATSEQAAKIRTFYKEFNAEKARLEAANQPETYKAKVREIGEAYANKLRAILTPEQRKTFEAIIAQRDNK